MRSSLVLGFFGLATIAAAAGGCGSDSIDAITAMPAAGDGGMHTTLGLDASHDAPSDVDSNVADAGDGGTSPMGDADAEPTERLLVSLTGGGVEIIGVTTDEFLVYEQDEAYFAVPIAGGTPQTLVSGGGNVSLAVKGKVVYWLKNYGSGPCPGQSSLFAWTSTTGTASLSTVANANDLGYWSSVAVYGTRIVFQAWHDTTCTQREVHGNDVAAPYEGSFLPPSPCAGYGSPSSAGVQPFYAPNGMLLVRAGCVQDGGTPGFESDLFNTAAATEHMSPVRVFVASFSGEGAFDPTGAWAQIWSAGGGANFVETMTGTVVASDPNAAPCVFDATGAHAYFSSDGALKGLTLSATSPASTVLAPSGISYVLGPTDPSGQFLLDEETAPAGTDAGATAVYLRPVTPGAQPTLLVDANPSTVSLAFTVDGSHALALRNDTNELWSLATGAATPTRIATGIAAIWPIHGTKVLAVTLGATQGIIFDVSGSVAPWTITPAGTNRDDFFVTPDGAAVVYVEEAVVNGMFSNATAIYVVPVP